MKKKASFLNQQPSGLIGIAAFLICFLQSQITVSAQTPLQPETRTERYTRFNPGWSQASLPVQPASATPIAAVVPGGPQYRADRIIIKPKRGIARAALSDFHGARGAKVLRTFDGLGGMQVVSVPDGETVAGLVAKYERGGLVEFAEPDYTTHIAATVPNDPYFTNATGPLWGLYNFGQSNGTPHADIDALEAWDVLTSASNIIVAVLDTGILATHEDLASNMWLNTNDGSHGFNALAPGTAPDDDNGHGTLMAGIIGGVGNNGLGVTGVAWQVQLMACKSFDSSGNGTNTDIIAGINFAITNGARIISASFSGASNSLAMSNAITAARDAGIIFVSACGNGPPAVNVDTSPRFPACYNIDNVVSVEYTTRTDALGFLSNFGATNVDLAAPGDSIYSTFVNSDSSYFPPFGFGVNVAGTSFAAAYVSGSFALMLAKFPTENYQQIIDRLLKAVDPVPALAGKCVTGGRLNLRKALSPPLNLTFVASAANGPPRLHLSAGPRRSCVIQFSTDLGSWTPVYTNITAADGTFDFTDSQSTNSTPRFYRAQSAL